MDANDIVQALRQVLSPPIVDGGDIDGNLAVFRREDYVLEEMVRTAPPARIFEERITDSYDAMRDYVNRYKVSATTIFVEPPKSAGPDALLRAKAIIDYHESQDKPDCNMHKMMLRLPLHSAASAWLAAFNRALSQIEFGELVEEYGWVTVEPEPVTLIDGVINFQSSRRVEFHQSIRLSTGEHEIKFSDKEGGAKRVVRLPERIKLRPPVFDVKGIEWPLLECRLRTRVKDGDLAFIIKPLMLREWMKDACDLVCGKLRQDTETHVYIAEV